MASLLFLILVSFYFLVAILIPPFKLYPFAGILCRITLFVGGQWLKIEGETPQKDGQPYIYLFNHASMFDGFMIVASVPH